MINSKFSRRAWLKSTGLAAGLLPLLDSSHSFGADAPKRLVIFKWTSGAHPSEFWPASTAEDLTAAPLPRILKSLEPWKKDVIMWGGLDYTCFEEQKTTKRVGEEEGHSSSPVMLTGWGMAEYGDPGIQIANGPSIDQVLGYEMLKTAPVKFPVLNLSGRDPGAQNVLWKAARQPVSRDRNPFEVYKKVFGGVKPVTGNTFDQLKAQRKTLVDYVGKDLEAFGRRLGTRDKVKIQQHIAAMQEISRQLDFSSTLSCMLPKEPTKADLMGAYAGDFSHPLLWDKLAKLTMDMAHAALACDLTRVITLELTSPDGEDNQFLFLPKDDPLHGVGMHTLNHGAYDPKYTELRVRADEYMFSNVAHLVKKLAETPEGDGRMLDNTIVLCTNLMGDIHRIRGLPFMTIGNAGKAFKTGRYLRYGDWAKAPNAAEIWRACKLRSGLKYKGVPHNGLLVSIANALGFPMKTFGDPAYGGALAGTGG